MSQNFQPPNPHNFLSKSFGDSAKQQTGIKITKLIMFETGTYNVQYRRPYETVLTGDTLNTIQENINVAKNFSTSAFSGVASQFLQPSSNVEGTVNIANGWQERRMRFLMEIENTYSIGSKTTEMVQGYTTHVGVTNRSIDPQMIFFINSVTLMRTHSFNTPFGMQSATSIFDSSHVLANNNFQNGFIAHNEQRLRPADVLVAMGRTHLPSPESFTDLRTVQTQTATKSKRVNNNANHYLSSLLDSYNRAHLTHDDTTRTELDVLEKARSEYAKESLMSADPFICAISQVRNTGFTNTFTFGDLRRICPNVEDVTIVRFLDSNTRAATHVAGQTAEWGGSDLVTTTATVVSNAVPALMMELGLTSLGFKTTNHSINSEIVTSIFNAKSFSSGDNSVALQRFIINLETNLLRDISFNNQISFAITMNVDLLGETWIKISLDGSPEFDFVTPSFSDSLLSPIVTTNNDRVLSIASDFENLTNSLIYSGNDNLFTPTSSKFGSF